MESLLTTFFKTTYSLQQAKSRLRKLRAYLLRSFFLENPGTGLVPETDPWLVSQDPSFYKEFNRDNVYQKLRGIEEAIAKAQPLVLYVTFDIPDEEVDKLGLWIRRNCKANIFFDIRSDPNLLGGCAMSWHGVYKDYSVRSRIEMNKDKILANLKGFTK